MTSSQATSNPIDPIQKKLQRQNRNLIMNQRLAQLNPRILTAGSKQSKEEEDDEQDDGEEEEIEDQENQALDPKSIEAVKQVYAKKLASRSSVSLF